MVADEWHRNVKSRSFVLANRSRMLLHRQVIQDFQFVDICRNTSSTAEYLCERQSQNLGLFTAVNLAAQKLKDTNAAAAAKLSNGFATVVTDTKATNSTMKADITPSLWTKPPRKARIHSGAISMIRPRVMMKVAVKRSIFSSEM